MGYNISHAPLLGNLFFDDELYSYSNGQFYYYDVIYGAGGNDTIHGGDLDDQLYGGQGNDILEGNGGDDLLNGGAGSDVLIGGSGEDTVSYEGMQSSGSGFSFGVWVDLASGRGSWSAAGDTYSGIENATGTDWGDRLYGDNGANELRGGGGGDRLEGRGGDDLLYGGEGGDTIVGGEGDDDLFGDNGGDVLYGGIGYDNLFGGSGNDVLNGGNGDDDLYGGVGEVVFKFTGNWGEDEIYDFEDGLDLIAIEAPGLASWEDLDIQQDGDDVGIFYGSSGIYVVDADVSDFSAQDFVIT